MELRFLGTGNAWNSDGRGSPALLVSAVGRTCFLVDVGPTALHACARFGVDCAALDRLFLTHLHGDHTAGWPFLLLHQVSIVRRTRPFEVYGPPGTRRHLEALSDLCYGSLIGQREFEILYHELPMETTRELACGGLSVDVWPMLHHATSLGYRFEANETSLGVSGDTAWCENLERLASSSDVLVLECSSVEPSSQRHVSLAELRLRLAHLGPGRILLVHGNDQVAARLAADPLPRVLVPGDGDTFSFPSPPERSSPS